MSLPNIDTDSLTAITQALSEALDKKLVTINTDLGNTIENKLDQIKVHLNTDLGNSIGSTLKKGMDEIVTSLIGRQEAFEAKSEQRLNSIEKDLTTKLEIGDTKSEKMLNDIASGLAKRHEESDTKNEFRFIAMEKQLSELRNAFSDKTNHFPPLHHHQTSQPPHSGPPHPAMLPQPQFSPSPTVNNSVQSPSRAYSHEDMSKIRDMVHVAKFSVGFGPITSDNIRSFNDQNQAIAIRMAAVDFLRKKLGISEHEIRQSKENNCCPHIRDMNITISAGNIN